MSDDRGMLIRQFRWLLIRNGLTEDEANRAIEELRREFANAPVLDEAQFSRLCNEIADRLVNQNPEKLRRRASRILTFVVAIGTGIVANKLSPLIPDFVGGKSPPSTPREPTSQPTMTVEEARKILQAAARGGEHAVLAEMAKQQRGGH